MNLEAGETAKACQREGLPLPSRWILERLDAAVGEVGAALSAYRFDVAANTVYHFVWDELCDWYLEISKSYLADPAQAPVTRLVLKDTLDAALRLLHPFMPFVTEEIWQRLPREGGPPSITVAPFPAPRPAGPRGTAAEMDQLIALVTGIRTIRATYEVEPRRSIDVSVAAAGGLDLLERHRALIQSLGRIHKLELAREVRKAPRTIVQQVGAFEIHIPMAGLFDLAAEKGRLTKERAKVMAALESLRGRLSNPQFVARAKPAVVAECRQREVDLLAREAKIGATLHDLGAEAAE
jgi:valyl-tRNA synthetase